MVAYLSYAGTLFTDRNGWKAGCTLLVSPSDLTSHTNWRYRDSNPGPLECEAGALPLELYKLPPPLLILPKFPNLNTIKLLLFISSAIKKYSMLTDSFPSPGPSDHGAEK